jgi:hypothetical protein
VNFVGKNTPRAIGWNNIQDCGECLIAWTIF